MRFATGALGGCLCTKTQNPDTLERVCDPKLRIGKGFGGRRKHLKDVFQPFYGGDSPWFVKMLSFLLILFLLFSLICPFSYPPHNNYVDAISETTHRFPGERDGPVGNCMETVVSDIQ